MSLDDEEPVEVEFGPDHALFAGHDAANDMHHMAIPELAGARTIAAASALGSSRARRQAKVMGWILISAFIILPILIAIADGLGLFD